MKMRSWSSRPGIMLVPSTFTGWYRKMIIKADMPREITRSRTQLVITGRRAPPREGEEEVVTESDVSVPGIAPISILIRNGAGASQVAWELQKVKHADDGIGRQRGEGKTSQ